MLLVSYTRSDGYKWIRERLTQPWSHFVTQLTKRVGYQPLRFSNVSTYDVCLVPNA